MKTPIVFEADQFNYSRRDRTFVAEASSLGLKPGEVLERFTIRCRHIIQEFGHPDMPFHFTDRDFSGGDVAGWRYHCSQYAALIIND